MKNNQTFAEFIKEFKNDGGQQYQPKMKSKHKNWFVSNGCTFWYDPLEEFDINSDSCEHTAVKNYIKEANGIASSLEDAIEQAKNIGIQFFTEEECQN